MRDELDAVNSELVFLGVSKKTPDTARPQVREPPGDSRRGKRTGDWRRVGKGRGTLEAEMRRVLIDFFERFFLWCALFRPVKGSRGMRAETLLTRFGKGASPGEYPIRRSRTRKGALSWVRV